MNNNCEEKDYGERQNGTHTKLLVCGMRVRGCRQRSSHRDSDKKGVSSGNGTKLIARKGKERKGQ